MFIDYIFEKARPVLGLLALAWQATFRPIATGRAICLGDRQDFNHRLSFLFALGAAQIGAQTLFAAVLGVQVMPSQIDAFWQYIQPFVLVLMFLFLFLPIRLLGWTKVSFAEYFQAAAMSAGPGFLQIPLIMLPAALLTSYYGQPNISDPRVEALLQLPGTQALAYCVPEFSSLICLNMLAAVAPETAWTGTLSMVVSFLLCVPIVLLIKAATGIQIWKQVASFILFVAVFAGVIAGVS